MRSTLTLLFGALLLAACGDEDPGKPQAPEQPPAAGRPAPRHATIDEGPHLVAVLHIKDMGDIEIELLPEVAPKTAANFVELAGKGFYDGTQFHRVIPGFMIQGGDPNTKGQDARNYGKGGPGYTIEDEFSDIPHTRGMVSMAKTRIPNSGGSQFFILHGDATRLDGKHTIFGRVVEGMEVVDTIAEVEIDQFGRYGPKNRPYPTAVVVESVRIEAAGSGAGAS
jgi:peptidyl-prolyl cis-trans isomerase B (cyclophilin B)